MKWFLLAVVVVVVAVAAFFVVRSTAGSDGPPPVASGAGVFRLHTTALANGGQQKPDHLSYGGVSLEVGFGGASGSGDDLKAGLTLVGPDGTVKRFAKYAVGDTAEVDGARIKVRAIWAGGSDADDVVDVQVLAG